MEKIFHLKENNTTVKTEIIAGITTFMAMAYILMVNPAMFQELGVVSFGAIYVSTALSAVVGSLLIGFIANLPLAQAAGMGLNAFFVYTVCLTQGFTYANALVFILADGLIFVLLTATGLRKLIFESIPDRVKMVIPAGIGLFLAMLGFQDAGIVVPDASTGITLASFNLLGSASWASVMPMIVTIITLVMMAIMSKYQVKGAILWSILLGAVLYYILGFSVPGFYNGFLENLSLNPLTAIKDFNTQAFGKVFTEGFDFSAYLAEHSTGSLVLNFITTSLAFCMIDMFDTLGTLYAACRSGNLFIKNEYGEEEIPHLNGAMLSDAIATCTGAIFGTSTVTTFVEASAGVAVGGRTGLAAIVTAMMFLVSTFLSPIAGLIPAAAYSAALVFVGILMMGCLKDMQWENPTVALPSFMTLAMIPFTYNISYGIAFGLITYVLINLVLGKRKEIKAGTWVITILFTVMFFCTH